MVWLDLALRTTFFVLLSYSLMHPTSYVYLPFTSAMLPLSIRATMSVNPVSGKQPTGQEREKSAMTLMLAQLVYKSYPLATNSHNLPIGPSTTVTVSYTHL